MDEGSDRGGDLFSERSLRKYLSNVYVSMIGSSENTRIMLECHPADIRPEQVGGYNEARAGMNDACAWMQDAEILCSDKDTFNDVILGVVRLVARYVVSARGTDRPTVPLDCWVFQKSVSYKDAYGTHTTLSMIVPEIESCMSIRLDADLSETMGLGFWRFESVLPMPLTNRLHNTTRKVSPIDGAPSLGDWNFLKISFGDRSEFLDSLEMDVYCEIASAQSKGRHHLGAPLILSGRIVSMDEFRITIQGIVGDSRLTVTRADGCAHTHDELMQMKDAPARFLIVEWYRPQADRKSHRRYAELLRVEAADLKDLRNDDMVGYVRLRGRVYYDDIRKRYGRIDLSEIDCLTLDGDMVVYSRVIPEFQNTVIREFFSTTDQIHDRWSGYRKDGRLLVAESSISSQDSTDMARIMGLLRERPALANTLSDIQTVFDYSGDRAFESDEPGWQARRSHVKTLERMGLLDTDAVHKPLTKKGIRVLVMNFKDEIERRVSDLDSIYLPELGGRLPNSVMLAHLQGSREFKMGQTRSENNKLLWVRAGTDHESISKECESKIAHQHGLILECMMTTNHPVTSKFIHGELDKREERIDYFSIDIMMRQLGQAGKLSKSGDSWEYITYWRIRDLVGTDKEGQWTLERVMRESKIGTMDKDKVLGCLRQIEREGLTVELSDGTWAWKSGSDQIARHADSMAKRRVLALLRAKKSGFDYDDLAGRTGRYVSDQFKSRPLRDRAHIVKNAILELKKASTIHEREGIYRIAHDPPDTENIPAKHARHKIPTRTFARCPSCRREAFTRQEVEDRFGFRNMDGVIRPQSWCKSCRKKH